MSQPIKMADRVVSVERRFFQVYDAGAAADGYTAQFDLRGEAVTAGDRAVQITGTVSMQDADVRFEIWDGEPPSQDMAPVGERSIALPSGSLTTCSLPQGFASEVIEVGAPGEYMMRVYRSGGGQTAQIKARQGNFHGLENYQIQLWRSPAP